MHLKPEAPEWCVKSGKWKHYMTDRSSESVMPLFQAGSHSIKPNMEMELCDQVVLKGEWVVDITIWRLGIAERWLKCSSMSYMVTFHMFVIT